MNSTLLTNLMLDPETKKSPCSIILSIFGCLSEKVPKILVEISSFLFSKKTGFSMTAKTSLEMAEHLSAIFFSPLSSSTYALVTC